ncbi:MAG: DNA methyltransferase, partial [Cytophagales bacterium]|nr:DNA methyltransferase [Cytophagales bacterium]
MNSECVDLIYLDPPWNKNDTFVGKNKKRIQEIKEWFVEQQKNGDFPDKDFEEVFKGGPSYDDIWKDSDVKDIWLSEIEGRYPDIIPYLEGATKYTMAGGYYYLIFMAIRLIELKRILKDTGSIYLHCDPTMSHYLKGLMDIIFGKNNFRNEIVWKRHGTGGSSKAIGNIHDIILYYVKTRKAKYNPVSVPLTEKQKAEFRMSDTKGLFITNHLEAQPAMQGGGTHYTYKGYTPELGWLVSQEKLKKMDEEGYVYWTKTGKPKRKYYLHEKEGTYINYYRLRMRDPVLQEGKAPPAIILKDTKEDLPKRKFVSDIEEIEYSRIFNIQKDILKIKKTPKRKKPLSKYEEEILK